MKNTPKVIKNSAFNKKIKRNDRLPPKRFKQKKYVHRTLFDELCYIIRGY